MRLIISELEDCAYDVRGQLSKQPGDLTPIHTFPGFTEAFESMKCFRALVTVGDFREKFRILHLLGITRCFDYIKICTTEQQKCVEIGRLSFMLGINEPSEGLVIGSCLHSEIVYGNAATCTTAHLQVGKYGSRIPTDCLEVPTFTLKSWDEFPLLQRDLHF
ncbi:MAG: hypothetical protein V4526_02970 [Patescibacteria group bacterium]